MIQRAIDCDRVRIEKRKERVKKKIIIIIQSQHITHLLVLVNYHYEISLVTDKTTDPEIKYLQMYIII